MDIEYHQDLKITNPYDKFELIKKYKEAEVFKVTGINLIDFFKMSNEEIVFLLDSLKELKKIDNQIEEDELEKLKEDE